MTDGYGVTGICGQCGQPYPTHLPVCPQVPQSSAIPADTLEKENQIEHDLGQAI
jgi:hypothetical protein